MERTLSNQCRVAIVGASRARVAKVVSLLSSEERTIHVPFPATVSNGSKRPNTIDRSSETVVLEYLPCVATFGSYENDKGETVRYLASVEYLGPDGKQNRGSSLAPFFDADNEDEQDDRFPGVSAVAIGCGIEAADDVSAIAALVESLVGGAGEDAEKREVTVETVSPNAEYSSMKEENDAYKSLDADAKAEAIRLRTIGPGKMAQFVFSLAETVVLSSYASMAPTANCNEKATDHVSAEVDGEKTTLNAAEDEPPPLNEDVPIVRHATTTVDPAKIRFACRRCRSILFGEDDLEDPPHAPSLHSFSRRKAHGHASGGCSSLFLSRGVDWMGDISAVEGKFSCPKCKSKLGSWQWAGAQCSCGTWVTPAIQVPSSKVDKVSPIGEESLPGTLVSPITNF